ncbi:hypothetical protein AAY473_030653 [Plecturocebus cupreus]
MRHHALLSFLCILVEMGFHCGQDGLDLLTPQSFPLASQRAGITDSGPCTMVTFLEAGEKSKFLDPAPDLLNQNLLPNKIPGVSEGAEERKTSKEAKDFSGLEKKTKDLQELQNTLLQHTAPWHIEYLKLKEFENSRCRKDSLTFPEAGHKLLMVDSPESTL